MPLILRRPLPLLRHSYALPGGGEGRAPPASRDTGPIGLRAGVRGAPGKGGAWVARRAPCLGDGPSAPV